MADIKQAIEYAKANPNTIFANELRSRIENGQMDKELKTAGLTQFLKPKSDVVGDIKETGQDLKSTANKTFGKIKDSFKSFFRGEQGGKETLYQAGGAVAGGVSSAIGDVFKGGAKAILPESAEQSIKSGVEGVVSPKVKEAMENPFVQTLMSRYEALDPETKRNIDATLGFTALATELVGGSLAKKPITTVVETGIDVAKKGANMATDVVSNVTKPVVNLATGIKDTAQLAFEGATRVPSRIATNVAEKKAVQETIKALPSKTAKRAVQDGVDIRDVQTLINIPKEQKPVVKKLVQHIKDFEVGKTKTDPMEVVGKPFVDRLKVLKTKQSEVGKQLGEVANTLTTVVPEDKLVNNVFTSLKSTNGLEGLKFADDGTLDFTDTVLATAETASDRSAIQSIFTDAVKSGTGKQKHLLRQELRESLGGKKKGGVQLTGTQEKAYESIRKGLSDTLDEINPSYKKVNTEYAKISNPLNELTKLLKATDEVDDDVLNLTGGVLARRLTSTGIGRAKVKTILNAIDKATKVQGKTLASVETLQDVMNVLNRYYDIAPRTGYQKMTEEGVSRGIGDFVGSAVGDVAGKTDAVRKKALENMLEELLSN